MSKIGIIGAGTWGLAIANLLAKNEHEVTVYARNSVQVDNLTKNRKHEKLPGMHLNKTIVFTSDLSTASSNKDVVIIAVPSVAFREVTNKVLKFANGKEYFVTVTKGMEDKTLYTMSEIIEDEFKKAKIKNKKIVALSGPTHAEEVSVNMPSMAVSASKNLKAAKYIQDIFMNECFRVYTNSDIKGVEICAAFKNVIGLASGMVAGLGYGDNIKAAVITRGLAEMIRAGKALGCKKDTFYGLAGLGDMVVTATSTHSRNYRCGVLIGKGIEPNKDIKDIGMVVEGVNFLPKAMKLIKKYKLELPITAAIYEIVYNGKTAKDMLSLLMLRSKKSE